MTAAERVSSPRLLSRVFTIFILLIIAVTSSLEIWAHVHARLDGFASVVPRQGKEQPKAKRSEDPLTPGSEIWAHL